MARIEIVYPGKPQIDQLALSSDEILAAWARRFWTGLA